MSPTCLRVSFRSSRWFWYVVRAKRMRFANVSRFGMGELTLRLSICVAPLPLACSSQPD